MENISSFNETLQKSIIANWDLDALTDYKGITLQYHDVARKIEKLHILFENSGVQRGDKIAICGRNCAHWAVAFWATLTYGAVAVPILHEFTPDQVHNIVNHSDAKILFVGDVVAKGIDPMKMPALEGIIFNPDYSVLFSRSDKLTYAREHLNEMFGKKYPKYFRKEHVNYYIEQSPDELCLINYTSGTTGFSKGVMIPYRAMWSNYDFACSVLGKDMKRGDSVLSILPMAHMYGMAFEFIFEFLQEGVPQDTEQPHAPLAEHARGQQEGAPADMPAGDRGLRRQFLRGDHRRCRLQPGGGVVPASHRVPLHGRLRCHGMRTHHHLRRLQDV